MATWRAARRRWPSPSYLHRLSITCERRPASDAPPASEPPSEFSPRLASPLCVRPGGKALPQGLRMRHAAVAALLVALAAMAAAAPGREAAAPKWRLSSHECPEPVVHGVAPDSPRTCTFRTLYLWGGRAYYLFKGKPPGIDTLGLDFELWRDVRQKRVAPDFLSVVTPAQFSALLAEGGSSGRGSGDGGGGGSGSDSSGMLTIPTAYFWRARKVLADPFHNITCEANSTLPGKSNLYHFLAEHMPVLSMTLCEQFGHCRQYTQRSALQIIDVVPGSDLPCHPMELYPPYYQEAIACLSDKPLLHINGSSLRRQLALVETAWMGLGPRCRGVVSGCYKEGGPRVPPNPAGMATWRGELARCFGLDPGTTAPLRPARVLLVDRLYESTRHILNAETLLRAIRARFPPELAEVRLEYMEGLTLWQQARLWAGATVVLHVHGAATGNMAFMPRGSQAVLLSPAPHRWHPRFARMLGRDLAGVSDVGVSNWANADLSRVQLVKEALPEAAARFPEAAELLANSTFMCEFQASFECPPHLGPRLRFACQEGLQRAINVAFPPDKIVELTEAALAEAYRQLAQEWVPLPRDWAQRREAAARAAAGQGGGEQRGQFVALPLQPSRIPFIAAAASGALLLLWLAVLRPMLRKSQALYGGLGRRLRPP